MKTLAARPTFRENLKSARLWIRLSTCVIALIAVLRAIQYLQSGGLVQDLKGPPDVEAGAYQTRSAHILMGPAADSHKKDH